MFAISLIQTSQHLDLEKGKQDTGKSESDQMTKPCICGEGGRAGLGIVI